MFCVMKTKSRSVMSCVISYYPEQTWYMEDCIRRESYKPVLLHQCAKEMEELNDPPIKSIPTNIFTVNRSLKAAHYICII